MKKTKIKVGDKEFPCRVTMGAMVRFKNESGKDVSKLEIWAVKKKKRPTRRKRSKRRGTVGYGIGVHRDEQRRL